MDGKKTRQYLLNNNLSVQEAASTIYGSMAVFAFDPKDHSNEIRKLVDPLNPLLYEIQTKRWNRLPSEIQQTFCQTFSTGLTNANRNKRATDRDWMKTFEMLQATGLVKCKCGKLNFGDNQKKIECNFCKAKLPLLKSVGTQPPKPIIPVPKPPVKKTPVQKPPVNPPISTAELTTVTFKARRDIAPTHLDIVAKRKQQLQGKAIYAGLNEGWMRIEYSKSKNMLSAVNLSNYTWTISDGGNKKACAPGGRVVLKKGLVITVLKRQLQLTVAEIK